MQHLSLVETHDTSAIQVLEASRDRRRTRASEATNAALRRAGLLKGGIGVGVAAAGIGLGILLLCEGAALLLNRPSPEEVARAVREQTVSIERQADQKIEAARSEAAERVTAAERAAADQAKTMRAALDRAAAAERLAAQKDAAAEKAAAEAQAIAHKFQAAGQASPSGAAARTVVDFSVFRHRETDRLVVTTGWKYKKLTDSAPSRQWCYVENTSAPAGLHFEIATDGVADPFDRERAARAGVTQDDVRKALGQCDWFRGHNPNIRDDGQTTP